MMINITLSNIADFIKYWEQNNICSLKAYVATAYESSKGLYTIGWGFTSIDDVKVNPTSTITLEEANTYLNKLLNITKNTINLKVSNFFKLSKTQQDAVTSCVYNMGIGNVPSMLLALNNNDFDRAATEFLNGIYQNGQALAGLCYRRVCEYNLFVNGVYEYRKYVTSKERALLLQYNSQKAYEIINNLTLGN